MWILSVLLFFVVLSLEESALQCSAENIGIVHELSLQQFSSRSLLPWQLVAEKLKGISLLHPALAISDFKAEATSASWTPSCFVDEGIPQLIPDPQNCRAMFFCIQGKLKKYLCPKNKVFSVKYQGCVKQMCGKVEVKDDDIQQFKECPTDGSERMYPHPTDCTKYYQCVHGDGIPRPCPNSLYFNPNLQICDWPERVYCKSQEFQSISDMD